MGRWKPELFKVQSGKKRRTLEGPVEARVEDGYLLPLDLQTEIADLAPLELHQIVVDVQVPAVLD